MYCCNPKSKERDTGKSSSVDLKKSLERTKEQKVPSGGKKTGSLFQT